MRCPNKMLCKLMPWLDVEKRSDSLDSQIHYLQKSIQITSGKGFLLFFFRKRGSPVKKKIIESD